MLALQFLGLNKYEERVYKALIKNPKSTASEIAKKADIPQNRVYDITESLINKKLVYLIPGQTKKFVAEDPQELRKIIREKKKELELLDKEFEELHKTYKSVEKQKVIISRNSKNFDKLLKEIPCPKTYLYTIRPKFSTKPEFIKRINDLKKKGVAVRIIADETFFNTQTHNTWSQHHEEFKFIDTKGVLIRINDHGVIISLLPPENESTIIYIENKNLAKLLADMYTRYYDSL